MVIRKCRKLSPIKFYYVRNVVLPTGRNSIYEGDISQDEKDAMKYNEELRSKEIKLYY